MKKNNLILLFFITIIIALSCNKEQDLNITLTEKIDGTLKIKLVDNAGNPLPGINLKLFIYNDMLLNEVKTDNNGHADFGQLIANYYYVYFKDVEINSKKYSGSQIIQVIAGINKEITINPEEFIGNIKVKIYNEDTYPYQPYSNLNVALVKKSDMDELPNDPAFSTLSPLFIGDVLKTDASGIASFTNIPVDDYIVIMYIDPGNYIIQYYNYAYALKNDTKLFTYYVSPYDF